MPSGHFADSQSDGKIVPKCCGILGDVVVELEHEAVRLEGADPFVRGDEHVRPLADAEHLEELQRVVVEALGRALAHHHLDALVRAFGLELLVQPLGRLHDIAGTQRPGRVLARPELELDGLLRERRRRGEDRRGRPPTKAASAAPQFRSSSVSSCSPSLPRRVHRVVVCCCKAVQRDYEWLCGAMVQPGCGLS